MSKPPKAQMQGMIDWTEQPPVPAEKIDWSRQGAPLRVRLTFAAMVMLVSILATVLGGGAYFYWGVRLHVQNQQVHVPGDGVPWGVKAAYEPRLKAQAARQELKDELRELTRVEHNRLRDEILGALKPGYRRSRRSRR